MMTSLSCSEAYVLKSTRILEIVTSVKFESIGEVWDVIDGLNEDEIAVLVIISDWLILGVKGDEFLIERHQRLSNIVTMMLIGQADGSAIERVRQHANLHAYIAKPWAEDDVDGRDSIGPPENRWSGPSLSVGCRTLNTLRSFAPS
ncbi:MAG: hypothetical protein AAF329_04065 [Cyanobacteria bacterium P01_A01_bin.17]